MGKTDYQNKPRQQFNIEAEWKFNSRSNSYLYSYNYYDKLIQNLYFERGEGEMSVFVQQGNVKKLILVTVIDISTLYQEKRGKAFDLISKLFQIRDDSLVKILNWWNIEDQLIFVEQEAPSIFYQQHSQNPS